MENELEIMNFISTENYEAPQILAESLAENTNKFAAGCPADGTGGWGCCISCERTN